MDSKPDVVTLLQQLEEKLSKLSLDGGARPEKDGLLFRRLWADSERIQRDDPVNGSISKAKLLALAGDIDAALYWLENAKRNGGLGLEVDTFLLHLIVGNTQKASELFDQALANRGSTPLHMFIRYAACAGWFDRVEKVVALSQEQKVISKATTWIHLAPRAARILEGQKFSRDQMNETIAEMQRILNEERCHWVGESPLVSLHGEGSPYAYVRMQFPVAFGADKAAELSWRLAERLVEKDLDRPGLIVNFVALQCAVPAHEMTPVLA